MNYGIGHRCSSHLVLLGLWFRLAAYSFDLIPAWERPCATGVALKDRKKKREKLGEILLLRIFPCSLKETIVHLGEAPEKFELYLSSHSVV